MTTTTSNICLDDPGRINVTFDDDVTNTTAGDATGRHATSSEDAMTQTWLLALFICLYGIVFVLGISGNSLVIYAVLHSRSMHTITNAFITNLAASDILMCLLAVPFTPISGLLQTWVFGEALCHLVPMVLGVSVHVSTLTSTAIAVDRFFVIVYPFRRRISMAQCLTLVAVIWIVSASISLPLALYQKISWLDSEKIFVCHEQWPQLSSRQFFTITSLVLQYIIPCSIITFCYIQVSQSLSTRARAKVGMQNRKREQLDINRKRRTNRMLIAMVSIFVCCWLPLNVIHLILEFKEDFHNGRYFLLVFFVTHIVAMSSIVYNPFLYAWMNDNFRKEFRRVLPCLFTSTDGTVVSSTSVTRRFSTTAATANQTSAKSGGKRRTCTGGTAIATPPLDETGAEGISNVAAIYDAEVNGVSLRMTDHAMAPNNDPTAVHSDGEMTPCYNA